MSDDRRGTIGRRISAARATSGNAALIVDGSDRSKRPMTVTGKSISRINVAGHGCCKSNVEVVASVLALSMSSLALLSFLVYVTLVALFALFMFWAGPDCLELADVSLPFDFGACFWFSVHTFTTIGYGNAYPTCASTQLIVLLEGWFSIAITALIGGYIFFFVTRPPAQVRFSDKLLLSYKNGQPCLTFRCIAYGRSDLFDAKITVAVRVTSIDLQTGSSKSSRYSLALESDSVVELDQWQVWHCIDETSPFWSLTDNGRDFTHLLEKIKRHVSAWQISLEAFNELYMMNIRAWTYYNSKHDFDEGDFDDMLFKNESSEAGITESIFICDQSLLNKYTPTQSPPLREAEARVAV